MTCPQIVTYHLPDGFEAAHNWPLDRDGKVYHLGVRDYTAVVEQDNGPAYGAHITVFVLGKPFLYNAYEGGGPGQWSRIPEPVQPNPTGDLVRTVAAALRTWYGAITKETPA